MSDPRTALNQTAGGSAAGEGSAVPPRPGLVLIFSVAQPVWSLVPMPASELLLGRDSLGTLCEDPRISRHHARVVRKDDGFSAIDLGSRNGSAVDGQVAIPHTPMPFSRCLRIGDTLLLPVPDLHPYSAGISISGGMVVGPQLANLYQRIGRVAAIGTTLHITGESGSGKENAARTFHSRSPAARGPFVPVNCAAIPEGIAERLLFGVRRGAFSGATADAEGYVQAAHGGTLFLDEVAELPLMVQAKLLRVLESREVLALGAVKPQPVSIQICSASHRSLHTEVASKRLREDLYYRIGRPAERIQALRERCEEIPWLVDLELRKSAASLTAHVSLIEECLLRRWPGNVRELLVEIRSAAQEALATANPRVRANHLSAAAGQAIGTPPEMASPPLPPAGPLPELPLATRKAKPLGTCSRAEVIAALIEASGKVAPAARALGVHRTELRRYIESSGIDLSKLRQLDER